MSAGSRIVRLLGGVLALVSPLAIAAAPVPPTAAQTERPAGMPQQSDRMQPLPRPAIGQDPDSVFKALDTDGNGSISRAEFDHWWSRRGGPGRVRVPLRGQFDRLDTDRSGSLNATEYAQMVLIRRAGPQAPPLSRFDANRNGGLEFEEYVQLVNHLSRIQTRQPAAPGASR